MKYATLIAFLLQAALLCAQERLQDVVLMQNGNTYRGKLLEIYPDSVLKIRTAGKSIYTLPMKEVKKISAEEISYTDNYWLPAVRKDTSLRQKGYTCIAEIMGMNLYGFRSENNRYSLTPGYSFLMVHGYLFNPHLSVGVGGGIEVGGIGLGIPAVADVRYNFLNRRVTPFVAANTGYLFISNEAMGNRLNSPLALHYSLSNVGIGVKFGAGDKCYMLTSMGYKLVTNFKTQAMHAFSMKLGVVY